MKDAFYFPHDSNAKDDPKCSMLIEQLGLEGYGIYWVLIETLRDQPSYRYPLSMLPIIARKYNTTAEKVRVVVGNYGLFTVTTDEFFLSDSLCRRMEKWDAKRIQASEAGKISAQKRLLLNVGSTDVQRTLNERSTNKRREEKIKEDNTNKEGIKNGKNGKNVNLSCPVFEKFYLSYPRHEGRADAEKAWRKVKESEHEALFQGLNSYKVSVQGKDKQYIAMPATWLNGRRWEDETGTLFTNANTITKAQADAMDRFEYLKFIQDGGEVVG